ncbi:MAG: protein translocase subunit SecF [Carbonactinosporaceae bacterium]
MGRVGNLGAKLYSGEVSYDFVGRRRIWYAVSVVALIIAVAAVAVRGLHLGVEFQGGAVFVVKQPGVTVDAARTVVSDAGVDEPIVQTLGDDQVRIQVGQLSAERSVDIQKALAKEFGVPRGDIQTQVVGPTWGEQISQKALLSLVVFLAAVVIYLSVFFEWKMATSAIVALLHDVLLTIGVYAFSGFEVTPATVIGLLTILGYSLYDTVVVFDKVRENTKGLTAGSRRTYSQAANLAVNQTLVRSINTSVIALLPVAGLLFIGVGLLGAGVLKDLALVLFVGIAAGTYSSIFIATPLVADLKEREPQMRALAWRVENKRAGAAKAGGQRRAASPAAPGAVAAPDSEAAAARDEPESTRAGDAVPAGARAQPKRGGSRPGGGRKSSKPGKSGKAKKSGKKRR